MLSNPSHFQKLKFALIESLNVNLPLSVPVDRQFLKEVLPQMLKDHSLLVPSGGKSRGLFGRETLSINSDKTRVDTAVKSLMAAKPVLGEKEARAFTINHA